MTGTEQRRGSLTSTGDALFDRARWSDAATAYRQAIDAGEPLVPALRKLMVTWAKLGDLDRLDATAGRVLAADPHDADATFWLGWVAHRRGDLDRAAAHFRRVLAVAPHHRPAAGGLAEVETAQRAVSAVPQPAEVAAAPENEQIATLAEVIDKRLEPPIDQLPGLARVGPCRPLLRSMVADLWPVPTVVAVWAVTPSLPPSPDRGPVGWIWSLIAGLLTTVRSALPVLAVFLAVYLVLRWWTTEYVVYDRRVEVHSGVLYRRHQVLWLYEISRPIVVTQNLPQMLCDTGTILIESPALPHRRMSWLSFFSQGGPTQPLDPWGRLRLAGIRPTQETQELADVLRRDILRERRAMLDRFIGNP